MRVIRKEIIIDAPVSKVWEHITDSAKIASWLMPNDFEAIIDKIFFLDCGKEGPITCEVKEIIPFQRLVYSFKPQDMAVETLVTITLTPENGGTRLTLVHSGWSALPPSEQGIADDFEEGWGEKLKALELQIMS
jgi:uncharacterized protein YndB with AHSA1/START domain